MISGAISTTFMSQLMLQSPVKITFTAD